MYGGLVNSPITEITSGINTTDKTIVVRNVSAMPEFPNLLVLGGDTDNPETIKLVSVSGSTLTVERAFQGTAQVWPTETTISRNFTEYDYSALKYNIEVLGSKKEGSDIQARREILDIKLKLDELEVVDYINKTGIGFFDLFKDKANIDIGSTTAVVDTVATDVVFTGSKILKFKSELFDTFNNIEISLYDKEREYIEMDTASSSQAQFQITMAPGAIVAGDKFFINGKLVTVTSATEV